LRKSPKQARSKELVDAVMDAAARILEKSGEVTGIDGLTTNKVAKMAGVSIGSLYQYFPSKDAIFAKLIERNIENNTARLLKQIESKAGADPQVVVSGIIADIVDLFSENRAMIALMFGEVPKLKKTRDIIYRRNRTITVFIEYLRANPKGLRDPDHIEEQVYVIAHATIGLLQVACLEDFEKFEADIVKRQLQRMAQSFLFVSG
jgi:AcrR family transcriptional regulator